VALAVGIAAAPVDEVLAGSGRRAVVLGAGDDDGIVRLNQFVKGLNFFGVAFFGFDIQRVERQVDVAQRAVGFFVAFDQLAGCDEQVVVDGFLAVAGAEAEDFGHAGSPVGWVCDGWFAMG